MSDDETLKILAENVQRLLEKREWTANRLAIAIDENPINIYRILNREHMPGVGFVSRLAAGLDTSVDFLLKRAEKISEST